MADEALKYPCTFRSRKEVFFLVDFFVLFIICLIVYLVQGWIFNLYYINGRVEYLSRNVIAYASVPAFWSSAICTYFFRLTVRGGRSVFVFSIAMAFLAALFFLIFIGGADGTYNSYYGPLIYKGSPTLLGMSVRLFNPYVAFALASSIYLIFQRMKRRKR